MVALDRPGTLGLLEREAEMAQLRAALDAVRAGTGRLVAVQGAAGIGKSALLAATAHTAAPATPRFHASRACEWARWPRAC